MVTLVKLGSSTWVCSGSSALTNTATSTFVNGSKTLTGTLDRVRLTTTAGANTFDAGSVKVLYE